MSQMQITGLESQPEVLVNGHAHMDVPNPVHVMFSGEFSGTVRFSKNKNSFGFVTIDAKNGLNVPTFRAFFYTGLIAKSNIVDLKDGDTVVCHLEESTKKPGTAQVSRFLAAPRKEVLEDAVEPSRPEVVTEENSRTERSDEQTQFCEFGFVTEVSADGKHASIEVGDGSFVYVRSRVWRSALGNNGERLFPNGLTFGGLYRVTFTQTENGLCATAVSPL